MSKIRWTTVALAVVLSAACAQEQQAPVAAANAPSGADNWEPGKDLAGTQVVIGGVSQDVPDDVAAAKRKLDSVEADYEAQMDELERKRQEKFSADADLQP
ncbi:MAG: hypothetical protein ABI588_04885 [Arenimonas sp.]